MSPRSPRALAQFALREWRRREIFADAIIHRLLAESSLAGPDRAFAIELFYGVLRNLTLLDHWIAILREGNLDHETRDVLRLGLYQLLIANSAEHAAVNETVAIASRPARGLVNAVLRSAQRRRAELLEAAARAPVAIRFSHPAFLVQRWDKQYGAQNAEALCAWNNSPPPIYARVNRLRASTPEFLAAHPDAEPVPEFPDLFRLPKPPAHALDAGLCYVQDPSTTVACRLLDPQPGEAVLDACAAPGGKSGLLAELMQNRGRLLVTDRDDARISTLQENLERLGVNNASAHKWDWSVDNDRPADLTGPFDRILADVPCSNTGVMRRRVDVRWRLTENDFRKMHELQRGIVGRVAPLLKRGGILVYSTCSLESEENDEVVTALLERFPFLELERQIAVTPFRDGLDGAFAARLVRRD